MADRIEFDDSDLSAAEESDIASGIATAFSEPNEDDFLEQVEAIRAAIAQDGE